MAKNIRWQIPFVSLQGIHYRVDIYDEGTFTPVQLTAGPTPFVTNEDDSDDFFHPVRSQSGTLQVCTLLPGTTDQYITLDDLLPANNIARPVRLINLDNSNVIEWQGFLSCEAYSQDYTGIPQILQLPVISVLEAMASVQLDQSRSSGLALIRVALKTAMDEIMLQSGMSFYTHVNCSRTSYGILNKYIDQTVLFEQKEYNNENSTTYIVSGLSVKDALERIATYMGWVVREQGTKIYFERMGDDISTSEIQYADFAHPYAVATICDFTTKNLDTDVEWMGADHQRTIAGGAKSVEVVAKLEKYRVDMDMPEFPYSDMVSYSITMDGMTEPHGRLIYQGVTLQSIVSKNVTFYNNCTQRLKELDQTTGAFVGDATVAQVLDWALINPDRTATIDAIQTAKYVGAFFARIKKNDDDYRDGLYIVGNHYWTSQYSPEDDTSHIFEMRSLRQFVCSGGKLILKTKVAHLTVEDAWAYYDGDECDITVCVKYGNKYWNGTEWTTNFARFRVSNADGANGYEIPCESMMQGEIFIRLYKDSDFGGILQPDIQYEGKDKFISELSLSYELEDHSTLTDRSENHYFRLLGTNFRDEVSISTDLASTLNNEPSPSLVMDDATTPMKFLNYLTGSGTESRRPEVDLLNRLAAYYGAARQRLELEVAHPTDAPLPLLRLNGINDGKVYLPLSESRDWQTDVCKLICFETPEEPAES